VETLVQTKSQQRSIEINRPAMGFFTPPPAAAPPFIGPIQPPSSVIDDEFGGSFNGGYTVGNGADCGPCKIPKTKRFITTVCPDGTTTTREHKSRKRRRRLATASDIKDLSSLKTILGGGKALETWLVKH